MTNEELAEQLRKEIDQIIEEIKANWGGTKLQGKFFRLQNATGHNYHLLAKIAARIDKLNELKSGDK